MWIENNKNNKSHAMFDDLRDLKCLKTQNVSIERQPTCPIKEMCPNVAMR